MVKLICTLLWWELLVVTLITALSLVYCLLFLLGFFIQTETF